MRLSVSLELTICEQNTSTMFDGLNVVLIHWLLKEQDITISKLLSELEWYKRQLAFVRETRALMRFVREQEYKCPRHS